jgi:hypothetical protein
MFESPHPNDTGSSGGGSGGGGGVRLCSTSDDNTDELSSEGIASNDGRGGMNSNFKADGDTSVADSSLSLSLSSVKPPIPSQLPSSPAVPPLTSMAPRRAASASPSPRRPYIHASSFSPSPQSSTGTGTSPTTATATTTTTTTTTTHRSPSYHQHPPSAPKSEGSSVIGIVQIAQAELEQMFHEQQQHQQQQQQQQQPQNGDYVIGQQHHHLPHSPPKRSQSSVEQYQHHHPQHQRLTIPIHNSLVSSQAFPIGCRRILQDLPGNTTCIDCGISNPEWACILYGTLVCINCSGLHRGLGVTISTVRSITMDHWNYKDIIKMLEGGNKQLTTFFARHQLTQDAYCDNNGVVDPTPSSSSATLLNKKNLSTMRYKTKAALFYRQQLDHHVMTNILTKNVPYNTVQQKQKRKQQAAQQQQKAQQRIDTTTIANPTPTPTGSDDPEAHDTINAT